MSVYLLDTNLLIALFWPTHQRHQAAVKWFTRHRGHGWATCAMTQTGFVRIVSNPAFSRDSVQPREAMQVLVANTAAKDHVFWPDDYPFAQAAAFAASRLVGHQQVADAYLLGLAIHRRGLLATLDQAIAALTEPGSAARKALELVS